MASLNVPSPTHFLPCPGTPAIPFKTWMRMFENYLLVINATGNTWPNARRRATLLHCLGTEGQRIFYSLPDTGDTYDSAVAALKLHFTPAVNVVVERHKFRKRLQNPHETVTQYIAALRDLASTCEFGDKNDEMLRDQLIEYLSNARIRERLLLELGLNLEKAITLATQMESAAEQAKCIGGEKPTVPVQAVQKKQWQRQRPKRTSTHAPRPPWTAQAQSSRSCFRCGADNHLANAPSCPAAKATCKTCNKEGHYARVCRSSSGSSQSVQEVEVPEITVLCVKDSTSPSDKITCTVKIQPPESSALVIDLVVDTGSSVSILPSCVFKEHFGESQLTQPTVRLVTYSKTHIPVLGCLSATVSKNDVTTPAVFFIVENGTPLLGMDLMRALNLHIVGGTVAPARRAPTAAPAPATPVMQLSTPPPLIGCAKKFVHRVKVSGSVPPVRQKLRRLPLSVRGAVTEEINRLLAAGVIERCDASAWVSPIVVTKKKNGGIRMCVDLREPNKVVIADCYPLPHIDELLSTLQGAAVFSTIDLASAYHQVPLHVESRDLTAFITHEGLFRYCRVPYGLSSAPSAFQKMLATILKGIPGVQNYLDDIIVYGDNSAQHDARLETVRRRLTDAGLLLNEDKCCFNQSRLHFLGHVVSAEGILPDEEHIAAVLKAPAPTDAATLRSFLGLVSWYNKFIPNYATESEPMRACIRQEGDFLWTAEAQQSFEKVKSLLLDSPALALFDPSMPTVVSTDASDYGLGAVLTQIHRDGEERTVAFASRTLTAVERKYSTVEKEALGCVWAVEKWRTFLWGRKFTLRTDHQALTTLLTTKGMGRAGMRIARWSARLLTFDYDVTYRPGSDNVIADCLSRLPIPAPADPALDAEPEVVAQISAALGALPIADFKAAAASCQAMTALRDQIARGWPGKVSTVNPDVAPYFRVRHELLVKDSLVLRGTRLVVPIAQRATLVALAHETHQGVVRTKQRLREYYWWPKMDELVNTTIQSCQPCQSNDKTATPHPAPLQPVPLPERPWQKVAIDIVGPFETATQACRYAITLVDYYSKWPEVGFTANVTTKDVTTFLTSVFSRHGNPEAIVTDNGPQFVSSEFAAFLIERDIAHHRVSVYYPAANGAVERFNRVLKQSVQMAISQSVPWKPAVTAFLMTYRATPHAATGASPFQLLHGRRMRTKLSVMPPSPAEPVSDAQVREKVVRQQQKMKDYADRKRGARTPPFQVGDRVRVKTPVHVPKAHPKFGTPQRIKKKVGRSTYLLEDGKKWNACHLAPDLFRGPESRDTQNSETVPSSPNRCSRFSKKPAWMQDYVTS